MLLAVSVMPFRFLPSSLVNHFYCKFDRNSALPKVKENQSLFKLFKPGTGISSAKELNEINKE